MAGRPPKPTALKLINGNPGKRALNKQEPDPQYLTDLAPPPMLPDYAKRIWEREAPRVAAAKLLTEVDAQAFAMGCVAMGQYWMAIERVGAELVKARMVEDGDGVAVEAGEHINPWALVQSMTFKQAMIVFEKFGMTPQARTRIAIQPQGDLFASAAQGAASYFS